MRLEARAATRDDLDAAAGLAAAAVEHVSHERGGPMLAAGLGWARSPSGRLEECLADEQVLVVLGLVEDVPVGIAVGRLPQPPAAVSVATIEMIFVDPEARAIGVGEEMLAYVSRWARDGGVSGIDVAVLPGAREAKNFFEAAGFVARSITMHRRLGAEG